MLCLANLDPAVDWPQIRTLNGRQDHRVGWASAVSLFAGLAETFRPAVHDFDDRPHSPKGYWSGLERALVKRTCQVQSDRPTLCFGGCTLDDDAGDGTRSSGDTIGTLGGYVDYDPASAAATVDGVRFDVFLRAQKALDDATESTGLVVLTPRRTAPFVLAPDEAVHFTLREGDTLIDEQWLTADVHGLVHTAPVALTKTGREAYFERAAGSAALQSGLWLGDPLERNELTARLEGCPGERGIFCFGLGDSHGPRVAWATTTAVCDERGRAEARVELAPGLTDALPRDAWIWARARMRNGWTSWRAGVVCSATARR